MAFGSPSPLLWCTLLSIAATLPAPAHAFGISTTTAFIAGGACVLAAIIGTVAAVVYILLKRRKSVEPNASEQKRALELEEGQQQQQQQEGVEEAAYQQQQQHAMEQQHQQHQQQHRALPRGAEGSQTEDRPSGLMYGYKGNIPPKIHEETGAWLTPVLDDAYDKFPAERLPSRSQGSSLAPSAPPPALSISPWLPKDSFTERPSSGQRQQQGQATSAYPPVPSLHPAAAANSAAVAEGKQGRALSPSTLPPGAGAAAFGGAAQRQLQQQQPRPVGWVPEQ